MKYENRAPQSTVIAYVLAALFLLWAGVQATGRAPLPAIGAAVVAVALFAFARGVRLPWLHEKS